MPTQKEGLIIAQDTAVLIEPEQKKTFTISNEVKATLEVVSTICVAFFVFVLIAFVLRGAELFVETQLKIPEAQAATISGNKDDYKSLLLLQEKKIKMAPGETKTYRVGFKNTGKAFWYSEGKHFISVYTYGPKYRKSVFEDSSWYSSEQPAQMKDPIIQPGMVGYVEFVLKAPKKIGVYNEIFQLAAEDLTWISGGEFTVQIEVANTPVVVVPTPTAPQATTTATKDAVGYNATLLLRSDKKGTSVGPGEEVSLKLGFKNSGTKTWGSESIRPSGVSLATVSIADFQHLSWVSSSQVLQTNSSVGPGELKFVDFKIKAPNIKGVYVASFQLVVDDVAVPGGSIDIPVTVTSDGIISEPEATLPAVEIIPEPILRVGIYNTTDPIMLITNQTYRIVNGSGTEVVSVAGGQLSKTIFDFNYKTFTVAVAGQTYTASGPLRFEPENSKEAIFTLVNYEDHPGWNKSLNDNSFRGVIEFKQAPQTNRLWVIEEVPISQYLYGLAETSNNTDEDFQSALAVAARTYAFYHYTNNTKHGGVFHIDSYYDQVYRGYNSEIRMPQWKQSVDDSRGVIATYNNKIAITPYYSRSDGRTRDWTEVWGGNGKPWLVSVPTPYDVGQTLWGHGVGMSARDALLRARVGASWQDIVKYYYTGVTLQKKWN